MSYIIKKASELASYDIIAFTAPEGNYLPIVFIHIDSIVFNNDITITGKNKDKECVIRCDRNKEFLIKS